MNVDAYNGFGAKWSATPAAGLLAGRFPTTTGAVVFQLPQGSYSLFSAPSTSAPTPLHGIGTQDVNFAAGQDLFFTLYWVPHTIFPNKLARAIVLTWQSKDAGTVNVDLDLVVDKYDPTTFTCIASCCTAYGLTGLWNHTSYVRLHHVRWRRRGFPFRLGKGKYIGSILLLYSVCPLRSSWQRGSAQKKQRPNSSLFSDRNPAS